MINESEFKRESNREEKKRIKREAQEPPAHYNEDEKS